MGLVGPNGIELSDKQDEAWELLYDHTHTEIFFGGGAGSTKSTLGCLWQVDRRVRYAGTKGFIGRDTYPELRDSTMATFFEVCNAMNYRPGIEYTYNAQDENVYWSNGSETHFRYMQWKPSDPDFHRFGSTEYTDALVDEAPGCHPRAVQVLSSRLRFKHAEHGLVAKLLLTGNPGDHWVKHKYVMDKSGAMLELEPHQARVLATLADHPDPVFREQYSKQLEHMDPYDRARLLHGDWQAEPRTGMEFFWAFDKAKHEKRIAYDPDLALHISFDFNSAPYMTLLVAQIRRLPLQRWHVHFLKEICLEHPLSTTKATCERMKMELKTGAFKDHKAGLFYYGDASGRNKTSMATEEVANNYEWVEVILRPWLSPSHSDRALRRNPPHVAARDFSNDIFAGKLPIEVSFDPDMHNTIRDFISVKQSADGGVLKEMVTDPLTKVRYEKGGHCGQAAYYLTVGAFPAIFEDHQKIAA